MPGSPTTTMLRAPVDRQPTASRWSFAILLACFVLSGGAALMYQTAWVEQLGLVFGATHLAVASVLAAYMLGLAVGAHWAGRWLDRLRRPLIAYAVLEVLIALAAVAVPYAFAAAARLRVVLYASDQLTSVGGPSSAVFYLVCTFGILFLPTAAMGASLPILARAAITQDQHLGPRIALLYGANTGGAALGVLVTAFWLLPTWDLGTTVWIAVGLNLLVSFLAWLLDRAQSTTAATARPEPTERRLGFGPALPIIACSGFVAFGWEIVWTRLLTHLVGGSLYAFGTMLSTFLAGIALGSLLAAPWARDRRRARTGLIVSQLGVALTSWAAFAALDPLAQKLGPVWGDVSGTALLAAATLLPSAVLMGAAFPCAVRWLAPGGDEGGIASARVFAWNTAGAIVGAVAVGFLLLPVLRFAGMATMLIALSLVSALAGAILEVPRRRTMIVGLLVGAALLATVAPQTPWRTLRTAPLTGRVLEEPSFYAVGRSATVLVHPQGRRARLSTNGLPESLIALPGARTSRLAITSWLSLLPATLRPDARSLMVIGLGAGITPASAPASIERVDVVELEPQVVAANQAFATERLRDPLADPRLQLHIDDARSALQLTRAKYDIVVSQPSHPWTVGSSHLFTREFFALVRQRLQPDGVFVQWIGLAFIDDDLARTLVATLLDVFSHVEVYVPAPGGALVIAASEEPLTPSADGYEQARADWQRIGVADPSTFLADRRLDAAGSRAFAIGGAITTDHANRFQTRSPEVVRSGSTADANRLFREHDALRSSLKTEGAVPMIRRLVQRGQAQRAEALVPEIEGPRARETALALLDHATGQPERAESRLLKVLGTACSAEDRIDREALAQLLLGVSAEEVSQRHALLDAWAKTCDPTLALVIEVRRQLALRNLGQVRARDTELAAVPTEHPAYALARSLRIAWRRYSVSPLHQHEALALVEADMPSRPNDRSLLVERLLLAAAVSDRERLADATAELTRHRGLRASLLDRAISGLDAIARSGTGSSPEHAAARATLIRARAARDQPSPAGTP